MTTPILLEIEQPATAWFRWFPPEKGSAKPGYWDYNHLEYGHSSADKPEDPFNRGWARATWRKAHGQLVPQPGGSPRLEYSKEGLFD